MINIRTIRKLNENDGLTLKAGRPIIYKSGWQVGFAGIECTTPEAAIKAVKDFNGNCGIWYSKGIYYIDRSIRISTKYEAMSFGRRNNQISILRWKGLKLFYC